MERSGGGFHATASRDMLFFHGDGLRDRAPDVGKLVVESAISPHVLRHSKSLIDRDLVHADVSKLKALVAEEILELKEDRMSALQESLHMAAFDGNTLGKSLHFWPFFHS